MAFTELPHDRWLEYFDDVSRRLVKGDVLQYQLQIVGGDGPCVRSFSYDPVSNELRLEPDGFDTVVRMKPTKIEVEEENGFPMHVRVTESDDDEVINLYANRRL